MADRDLPGHRRLEAAAAFEAAAQPKLQGCLRLRLFVRELLLGRGLRGLS
jgi:hypothetical protein